LNSNKKHCIIGTGGFAKEVLVYLLDKLKTEGISVEGNIVFMEPTGFKTLDMINGYPVFNIVEMIIEDYTFIVAIGNPETRKKVINQLPPNLSYFSIIHPSVRLNNGIRIGKGSIIAPGCFLTCDIEIGDHSQLNLNTTIGHDCNCGMYFTTAPAVNISGNCIFGNQVYLGTNACIRQGTRICDNVTVGMGSVVLKDIIEAGTYAGNPCKRIESDKN